MAFYILVGQNRQILRNHVPEDRAEDPQIETASITRTDHHFWIDLVCKSDTRVVGIGDMLPIHVALNAADSRYSKVAIGTGVIIHLHQSAVTRCVRSLREIQFIAQAQIDSQFGSYAPRVLTVEEGPLLELLRIRRRADVTLVLGRHRPAQTLQIPGRR